MSIITVPVEVRVTARRSVLTPFLPAEPLTRVEGSRRESVATERANVTPQRPSVYDDIASMTHRRGRYVMPGGRRVRLEGDTDPLD